MSISYELALKLKEAGFPQDNPKKIWTTETGGWCNFPNGGVFIPTLEELIEACGERFNSLERRPDGWRAVNHDNPDDFHFDALIPFLTTVGSTPIEAVANLYLALNKK